MATLIIHHNGWFFMWSTVADAPSTKAMRRPEFETWYRDQYGAKGMEELPARIERAERFGTSAHDRQYAQDLLSCNRAGPDETELSFDDVLKMLGIPQEPSTGEPWRPGQ